MKKLLWTIFVLYVIFAMVLGIVKHYQYDRDIDSWIDRTQVAANREDMLEYINELKGALEEKGMTKGHTALMSRKTPV